MSFNTPNSSQGSQAMPPMIPVHEYLSICDNTPFIWDDVNREDSAAWIGPVQDAGLDPSKHKVFHHSNKEYLKPPAPFIQQGPELGESGSTVIYKVTCPDQYAYKHPLALKIIVCKESMRPPGPDSNVRKRALEEVRNMAAVRHPHMVAYVASFEDYCIQTLQVRHRHHRTTSNSEQPPRSVFSHHKPSDNQQYQHQQQQRIKRHILGIAMYPPAQCNLRTLMNEAIESNSNPQQQDGWMLAYMHTYFGCLSQAVAYLHKSSVRIRHKDIKPENIVIDDFGLPLLTDFGLSKHFELGGMHSEGPTAKTLKYADPEAVHETLRDERSDIFSLGCVFLEMATVLLGKPLGFAEEQLVSSMRSGHHQFMYAESLNNLQGYMAKLAGGVAKELVAAEPRREASARAVVKALPCIAQMMHGDYHRRPYARELFPAFRHLYGVHESPGVCQSCEEERRTGRPSRPGTPSVVRRANTLTGRGH
ncbi:kinase-like domain-containing protein [Bombardia bombarda]|uniref:Kinase-like domain-containing protein n=1 Tax=Bombardia bombarda TaxID=252184 RepID=A0AA39X7N2_9PEZI|nr:kinase-like domain-containing protein [Bombardia bombarda]